MFGARPESKERCQRENAAGEFLGNARPLEEPLCSVPTLIMLPLCEQLELLPKLQSFFRTYLGEAGSANSV